MSSTLFTLPSQLGLELEGDALSISYDGDAVIEQTLGKRLAHAETTGDLTLALPTTTGIVEAGGTLKITGDVDAETLHGREVHIDGGQIKCRAISAKERIVIGEASLQVDVIIAPVVELAAETEGRVAVIESHNDRGATRIKGGFSLVEYEEMFGNGEDFLRERGLEPLGEAPEEPAAPASDDDASASDAAEPATVEEEPEYSLPPPDDALPDDLDAEPLVELDDIEDPVEEEDIDDPLSLSVEDLTILDDADDQEDVLQTELQEAVQRITACYEGAEPPPAVLDLQAMVQKRDYDELRERITEVWNGLLGFHQQRGIRPHHQVTHAFNVIHGLLQQ